MAEALIDGEAEGIVRAMVDAAKAGDTAAGRAVLDRLVPPRRDRPVPIDLPDLRTAATASEAMARIVGAVSEGDLTPSEAADLSALVDKFIRTLEAVDLEARITRLEEKHHAK